MKKTKSDTSAKAVAKTVAAKPLSKPASTPPKAVIKKTPLAPAPKVAEKLPPPKSAGKSKPAAEKDPAKTPAKPIATVSTLPTLASKKKPVAKAVESAAKSLAKPKAAKPDKSGPRIYQIYYQSQQKPLLDPELEPYNNIGDKSPLLEFNVFLKLGLDKELQKLPLWGALSWKFGQKTGLSGADLKKMIADNPGYDVYYCNPHPDTEALFHNLWLQGETTHPNFLVLCREFFESADLPVELLTDVYPSKLFSSANYFVGTPAFWERYLKFVGITLALANKKLTPTTRAILYSSTADKRGMHAESSYIPFIIERLFAVFLMQQGKDIKAFKLPLQLPESRLNVHLTMLRQMKDVAHAQKSLWLTACWANYRSLYLSTMRDKEWIKKHLKAVTPSATRFAKYDQDKK